MNGAGSPGIAISIKERKCGTGTASSLVNNGFNFLKLYIKHAFGSLPKLKSKLECKAK